MIFPVVQLSLWQTVEPKKQFVAGIDEVGRGCLFGPVVAAAVILPRQVSQELISAGVKDSKQLTERQRNSLSLLIREVAMDYQIGMASVQEINRLNILQASLLAMKRAILRLNICPDLCLIDGNKSVPGLPFEQQNLVKGDSRCVEIAAASIIAKVWRDELMVRLSRKYPVYDLEHNKGYGTKKHRLALQQYGTTPQHRQFFKIKY